MCLCVRDLGLVGKGCDVRGRVCVVARASRICAACLNLRGRTPVVGRRVSVTVATVTVTVTVTLCNRRRGGPPCGGARGGWLGGPSH